MSCRVDTEGPLFGCEDWAIVGPQIDKNSAWFSARIRCKILDSR
jgi:hypothetical protein